MHASKALILVFVGIVGVESLSHSTGNNTVVNTTTEGSTTATIENGTHSHCITGSGDEGFCVPRENCDYGTSAIDFTIYKPRGYQSTCENVCCPAIYIVTSHEHTNGTPGDDAFDFDDDD